MRPLPIDEPARRNGFIFFAGAAGPAPVPPAVAYVRGVTDGQIAADDPRAVDVQELLAAHLAFANEHTPPENIHALDIGALLDPAITFFSYRAGGQLLAVGALRQLDEAHAEIKSMHTARAARGRGIGRAMVTHLLGAARARGVRQVSLETGTPAAFAPARALYASIGFVPCEPFGDYQRTPDNTFMTLWLDGTAA